jgi:DNA-binding response OmpR family regulator
MYTGFMPNEPGSNEIRAFLFIEAPGDRPPIRRLLPDEVYGADGIDMTVVNGLARALREEKGKVGSVVRLGIGCISGETPNNTVQAFADNRICVHPDQQRVVVDGRTIDVSATGFAFLALLSREPDRVYDLNQINGALRSAGLSDVSELYGLVNRTRGILGVIDPALSRAIGSRRSIGYFARKSLAETK